MNSNVFGLFTFFMGGVFIYAMLRYAKPWPENKQHFFWLAALSPLVLTLFVLPGHVNAAILDGINAMVAGVVVSEYLRGKYGVRFENRMAKMKKFKQEVEQNREKSLSKDSGSKSKKKQRKDD